MSVPRPKIMLDKTTVDTLVGKNGTTFVEGVGVKFTATEGEVDVCGANDKAIGVAMEALVGDGVKRLQVYLLDGGVIKVKCSGTATAGEFAICGVDGFENQTLGGGTTVKYIAGTFMQSGVDGDFVGLMAGRFAAGAA